MSYGGSTAVGTVGVMGLIFWFATGVAMFIAFAAVIGVVAMVLIVVMIMQRSSTHSHLDDLSGWQQFLLFGAPVLAYGVSCLAGLFVPVKLVLYRAVVMFNEHVWTMVLFFALTLVAAVIVVATFVLMRSGTTATENYLLAAVSFVASLVVCCYAAAFSIGTSEEALERKYELVCQGKVDGEYDVTYTVTGDLSSGTRGARVEFYMFDQANPNTPSDEKPILQKMPRNFTWEKKLQIGNGKRCGATSVEARFGGSELAQQESSRSNGSYYGYEWGSGSFTCSVFFEGHDVKYEVHDLDGPESSFMNCLYAPTSSDEER